LDQTAAAIARGTAIDTLLGARERLATDVGWGRVRGGTRIVRVTEPGRAVVTASDAAIDAAACIVVTAAIAERRGGAVRRSARNHQRDGAHGDERRAD
jgi:hypothetical protein